MGIRRRAGLVASWFLVPVVVVVSAAAVATAATRADTSDTDIAKVGVVVATDFPSGFTSKPASTASDAQLATLARGIGSCKGYAALQRVIDAQPKAKSRDFSDGSRDVSNDVDVFSSEEKAHAALVNYGDASVPTCLEKLLGKVLTQQYAKDPKTKGKIKSVVVSLSPQEISGLGDSSVVYEGSARITGKDRSVVQVGLGNAAVQVGRAVSDYTYTTSGSDLTTVLQPAIDQSVARLRAALTTG